jgi:hypothetical protein
MVRMRVALVHKIVSISIVAFLLLCTPLQLAAQEKAPRAADQATAIAWLASLWNDFAAWLAGAVPVPPPSLENACSIDPWGGCHGS